VRGSLIGAAFITLLPIVLRTLMAPAESVLASGASGLLSSLQLVLFGLVIVVFMLTRSRRTA